MVPNSNSSQANAVPAIAPQQIADYLEDPEVRELAGVVLESIDPDARRLVVELLADAALESSGEEKARDRDH